MIAAILVFWATVAWPMGLWLVLVRRTEGEL